MAFERTTRECTTVPWNSDALASWQGALCRWLFWDDCDNNMVLSYEHTFGPLDWWKEFADKLIVLYLASRFRSVVVILPHPEYDRVPWVDHQVDACLSL